LFEGKIRSLKQILQEITRKSLFFSLPTGQRPVELSIRDFKPLINVTVTKAVLKILRTFAAGSRFSATFIKRPKVLAGDGRRAKSAQF